MGNNYGTLKRIKAKEKNDIIRQNFKGTKYNNEMECRKMEENLRRAGVRYGIK